MGVFHHKLQVTRSLTSYACNYFNPGKARRLKQAKEEAQDEIEKYRTERERQFRDFEAKHMGSREDVAAKIEQDTKHRIEEMNKAIISQKEPVCFSALFFGCLNNLYSFLLSGHEGGSSVGV